MEVSATTTAPAETGADTIAIGLVEGEGVAHDLPDGSLGGLLDSGEARTAVGKLALTHADGKRWLLVGLGSREDLDAESARRAAVAAQSRAAEIGTRELCWELPHKVAADVTAAIVEGTLLGAYRFDAYKAGEGEEPPHTIERLTISAHHDVSAPVARAAIVASAQNAARDLQNSPANDLTPTALGERAKKLASEVANLTVEVENLDGILRRGMGSFACVAQGSYEKPALITLRYDGPGATGPTLGFVGKAVTFDTGGISIKPSAKMADMKFDMSGGAAVLEAIGAIARLELPVRIVGVIGATENMPSGRSVKPGDIVTAMTGTTIEVNNTDAEGRLVLADCLAHAIDQGAQRLVDLATLTGAIVVALGSTYAGLFASDDEWAGEVQAAAGHSGELVWRLPLHREYAEMVKGVYADITNLTEARKASSITAAEFLHRFVGDTPWAHIDIAGTAYDADRAFARKGASGFGVRLLVELASRATSASA